MTTLGLDIGGANIKAANVSGCAISRPFAIWREPNQLQGEIAALLDQYPETRDVAVTMTAELADCFSTKAEGVRFIVDAVEAGVRRTPIHDRQNAAHDVSVLVWTTRGRFVEPDQAQLEPLNVAAANWHALATWCGCFAPSGSALLIDIGTTTTDIIPMQNGKPVAAGSTDLGRLLAGELSYSGIRRTPLCAVAHSVPFRDGYCPLAAELFATTLDIHLLTGDIDENPADTDTANGKPATKECAWDRLVRMLCCDRDEVTFDEAVQVARFLADVQRQRLAGALERVVHRVSDGCQSMIVSGSGSFLARRLISENRKTKDANLILLSEQFSPEVAEAACAYAVAQLASVGTSELASNR
jgi:probable H4MPT-linked C1 transfer pathway protein